MLRCTQIRYFAFSLRLVSSIFIRTIFHLTTYIQLQIYESVKTLEFLILDWLYLYGLFSKTVFFASSKWVTINIFFPQCIRLLKDKCFILLFYRIRNPVVYGYYILWLLLYQKTWNSSLETLQITSILNWNN